MKHLSALAVRVTRLFWRILSIPIFFKIIGIGVLVAAVFGSVTLVQVRGSISHAFHQVLELGITDQTISGELATVTQSLLLSLALCAVIGMGLAVWLTYILTKPIHHLVQTTNQIRGGDFETRAKIFSADEIGRLAIAINQMAEGLQSYRHEVEEKEKARLSLIEKIVNTQEEERRSISQELHDQLGQSLLALLLAVQSLGKDHKIPEETCQDIEDRIRQLIDEASRLAHGMRPPVLDDFGLDVALGRLMEEISAHSKLEVDYQYSCPQELGRLPNRVEVTLYRIAQEATTNVIRHASATRLSAVVLQRHDQVTLLIEDDGRGFDTSQASDQNEGHLGLAGMKERAALLGGNCAIESIPERGTTVQIRIPFTEIASCPSAS